MDFTEVMQLLKNASLFDLYRIKVAIQNAMKNPECISAVRQCFAIGDQISYFASENNALIDALVLEKNQTKVVVKNLCDQQVWNVPYYMINLSKKDVDIHAHHREKLTKNNFKIGDCVCFNDDGKQCVGTITKLNHKTANLMTNENKRWQVGYEWLSKILDGEKVNKVSVALNSPAGNLIEHDTISTD